MDEQNMNNSSVPNMQSTPNYQSTQNYQSAPNYQNTPNIPDDYRPISAWGYVGYQLLFAIPLVGFICILVFALGGSTNKNLKNFARSYLCIWLIAIILGVILAIIFTVLGVGIFSATSSVSPSSLYY